MSGCYAQHSPKEASALSDVDYVIGLDERQNTGWWDDSPDRLVIEVGEEPLKITPLNPVYKSGRSRPFIKIQDGCDKKCTYCVIPSIRGGSRSLSAMEILNTVEVHVDQGSDEIVLQV